MDQPNARPRRSPRTRVPGQSLVEFALVLPVILLLLLVSLDFGRVFLGYINVQNMARVAANFAANNPAAWGPIPDSVAQDQYANQVLADASATNCRLPVAGGGPVVPAPVFVDRTGNGVATDLGDNAGVQITCTFGLITPMISAILGGAIDVTAESNFPVKTGLSAAGGGGAPAPVAPSAAFIANDVVSERTAPYPQISDVTPFEVEFRDTSGGSPTSWYWDFGDGAASTSQDPLVHVFECLDPTPCTYTVSMTASNGNGSSTARMDVTVLPAAAVDFEANRTLVSPGMSVTFADRSATGATNWAWDFGDGGTANGADANPTHTYSTEGTYSVTLTVTYPTGDEAVTKAGYIRVEIGLCQVPDLGGRKFNDANAIYQGAPYKFTGSVQRDAGAPSGNFVITAQDLTATSMAPCTSNIKVTRP